MPNKDMVASPLPVIQDLTQDKSVTTAGGIRTGWAIVLKKAWQFLKGENEKQTDVPDPALVIILQIEDREVARIVQDLHYRTPKSLEAMRRACESCFVLPDGCPYYDYSIFDVKKAIRRLEMQPRHTYKQVVEELQKINRELAHHLSDYLE